MGCEPASGVFTRSIVCTEHREGIRTERGEGIHRWTKQGQLNKKKN